MSSAKTQKGDPKRKNAPQKAKKKRSADVSGGGLTENVKAFGWGLAQGTGRLIHGAAKVTGHVAQGLGRWAARQGKDLADYTGVSTRVHNAQLEGKAFTQCYQFHDLTHGRIVAVRHQIETMTQLIKNATFKSKKEELSEWFAELVNINDALALNQEFEARLAAKLGTEKKLCARREIVRRLFQLEDKVSDAYQKVVASGLVVADPETKAPTRPLVARPRVQNPPKPAHRPGPGPGPGPGPAQKPKHVPQYPQAPRYPQYEPVEEEQVFQPGSNEVADDDEEPVYDYNYRRP